VACPIISRMKIKTDRPMRQLSALTILSDVSPLTMLTSAEPRLNKTSRSRETMMILNINGMFVLVKGVGEDEVVF
jgi:hypothetical protein